MPALPSLREPSDWTAPITAMAKQHMRGVIDIYDPKTSATNGHYDPTTDAQPTSAAVKVLSARAARIQPIRTDQILNDAGEFVIQRFVRFQIEILPGDPFLREGLIVRVTDGGRDSTLTALAFQVLSAVNSSDAAIRTIEAVAQLKAVA